jgi:glycosyltransferase 2 family protein
MPPPPSFDALDRPLAPDLGDEGRTLSLRNLIVPVSLSVAVLAVVFWATYEPDTLRLMARMNVGIMALAVGVVGLRILLSGLRLMYIAHGRLSLVGGMRGGIAWDFMSAVTPSAMGGGPLAAYFLARDNRLPVGEATSILLFSMVADQIWFAVSIPLILLASPFVDIFPDALGRVGAGTLILFLVAIMLWAFFFAYATLIRPGILEAATTRVVRIKWLRRFESRVKRELVTMRQRGKVLRRQPPRFYGLTFFLTFLIWMTRYGTLVVVVLAVYQDFDALNGFLRTAAMLLTGLIVPTPGGSGGVEGLYVLFLAPLMPSSVVGPTLLAWRLLTYHLFLAAGLAVLVGYVNRRRRGIAGRPPRRPARSRRTRERNASGQT